MYCQELLKQIILKHEKQEGMINFSSNGDVSSSENMNKKSVCNYRSFLMLTFNIIMWIKMWLMEIISFPKRMRIMTDAISMQ